MLGWVLNLGFAAGGAAEAEPLGGTDIDSAEANYIDILEPKKAKKKIRIIRKIIRKKKAKQKAKPKEFDSTELIALQDQYKKLVALYAQVQKSSIKREAEQATKARIEAKKQADLLYQQQMEQQEAEDEAAMIEILLQFA